MKQTVELLLLLFGLSLLWFLLENWDNIERVLFGNGC